MAQTTIDTCAQRLAPESYLLARAPLLLDSLEEGRLEAWPMAKKAFLKFGNEGEKSSIRLLTALPDSAMRPLVEAVVTDKLGSSLKPENCHDIDRVMAPLEPLPATNLVDVLTEAMAIAGRDGKQMQVCRDT